MLFDGKATEARLSRPVCDHPLCDQPAAVDAATNHGPWGYFCESHHSSLCDKRLGVGAGQVLLCGDDLDSQLIKLYHLEPRTAKERMYA